MEISRKCAMVTLAPLLLGLSAFMLLPDTMSLQSTLPDTCGTKITQLEDQIEYTTSPKIIHYIENNTTTFRLLSQKYSLFWLGTVYSWNANATSCSAHLDGITSSFQLSNNTNPFIGVAHITVNQQVTKVTGLKIDIPNMMPH